MLSFKIPISYFASQTLLPDSQTCRHASVSECAATHRPELYRECVSRHRGSNLRGDGWLSGIGIDAAHLRWQEPAGGVGKPAINSKYTPKNGH